MATIDQIDQLAQLAEKFKQALILQSRGTRYDELTQASVALTAAQQTALATFISNQLASLKTFVAALT